MIKKTVKIVGNSRKWVPVFGNVFVGLNTVDSNGNTSECVYKLKNASGDLKMRGGVWAVDSSHGMLDAYYGSSFVGSGRKCVKMCCRANKNKFETR